MIIPIVAGGELLPEHHKEHGKSTIWLMFNNCITNVHKEQFQDRQYIEQLKT